MNHVKAFAAKNKLLAKAAMAYAKATDKWLKQSEPAFQEKGDKILDLLAQFAAIRRETERIFSNARGFVRPGFDFDYQENFFRAVVLTPTDLLKTQ